jgi:cell wall-associated NlpC family hydrolase
MRLAFVLIAAAVLSGCAAGPENTDRSAWLEPQGRRVQVAGSGADLDPITLIAAEQHPMTRQALQLLGINYRYGGTSPDKGFDCSGLVHYTAQASLGLKLPRRSADIARVGAQIKQTDLVVGDLVFFNTLGRRYSHVGIYIGSGYFVHAPASGGKVRVENMTASYWKTRYNGARRIDPILLASR